MNPDIARFVFVPNRWIVWSYFVLFDELSAQFIFYIFAKKMLLVDVRLGFQNVRKHFCLSQSLVGKFKRIILSKANNHYSLPFLRDSKIEAIENFVVNEIS